LKAQVCQRVAFAETAATGQTVLDTDRKGTAAKEIIALVDELLEVGHAS
jgi:chromosome partitioning protein